MKRFIHSVPWPIILVLCATLGMAPVTPQPHLVQKIIMLSHGELTRLIDIFDLFFHLSPFILLIVKLATKYDPPSHE